MKNLALFDFDGTITTKDSFIEFIRFYSRPIKIMTGVILLSPKMVLLKLGVMANWKAKEDVLTWFFKGETLENMRQKADAFCNEEIPKILKRDALAQLDKHKANGDRVVLVSASAELWLEPWTTNIGIELIGTKLEVKDGKMTGKINGRNCYGIQKVNRVKEKINLDEYDNIYVYGDSRGDKEMLQLADDDKAFYRFFSG